MVFLKGFNDVDVQNLCALYNIACEDVSKKQLWIDELAKQKIFKDKKHVVLTTSPTAYSTHFSNTTSAIELMDEMTRLQEQEEDTPKQNGGGSSSGEGKYIV